MLNFKKILPLAPVWLLWFLASCFYAHQYFTRMLPGSLQHIWLAEFDVSKLDVGYIAATFFYTYLLCQPVAGILINRFNRFRILLFATLLNFSGMLILFFAADKTAVFISEIFLGGSGAFALNLAISWGREFVSQKNRGLVSGITFSVGGIGVFLSGIPFEYLIQHVGWRRSLIFFTAIDLLIIVLAFICFPSHHQETQRKLNANTSKNMQQTWQNIKSTLTEWKIWEPVLYGCFQLLPMVALVNVWLVPFIKLELHTHGVLAYITPTIVFAGYIIGTTLWGSLSCKVSDAKQLLSIASVGGLITSLMLIYVNNFPAWGVDSLLLMFGVWMGSFSISISICTENATAQQTPIATSLGTLFLNLGGVIGLVLIGYILQAEIKLPHLVAYHMAFALIPCSFLVALILSRCVVSTST